jgi:hypothetical protein
MDEVSFVFSSTTGTQPATKVEVFVAGRVVTGASGMVSVCAGVCNWSIGTVDAVGTSVQAAAALLDLISIVRLVMGEVLGAEAVPESGILMSAEGKTLNALIPVGRSRSGPAMSAASGGTGSSSI